MCFTFNQFSLSIIRVDTGSVMGCLMCKLNRFLPLPYNIAQFHFAISKANGSIKKVLYKLPCKDPPGISYN